MYWSCCFSSFVASIKSCIPPYKIQPYFYVWILVFFCFIMCWAFPRLICPPTSWFRIGQELCRKWWVRTPAGPTLAIFLFFSLSTRKGCPRCDEGDNLQVLFHGTLLWYITSSILWAHLFLHVNSKNKIINAAVCVPTLNWCLTLKEWSAMRMPHI